MLKCTAYNELREEMWREVEDVTGTSKASHASDEDQLNALIDDKFQPNVNAEKDSREWRIYRDLATSVMMYITKAMDQRRRLQG